MEKDRMHGTVRVPLVFRAPAEIAVLLQSLSGCPVYSPTP